MIIIVSIQLSWSEIRNIDTTGAEKLKWRLVIDLLHDRTRRSEFLSSHHIIKQSKEVESDVHYPALSFTKLLA